jgi:glycosyltransferase involved in cell wall biosynthesis
MKVNMLVLNNFTADARVHKEAKALAEAGHQVTVIALHRPGLEHEETQHGYRVVRLGLRRIGAKGSLVGPLFIYMDYIRQVWRYTRQNPADVYHSHDGNTLPVTYPVVRRDRAAWVYDAHELETGRNFSNSTMAKLYHRLWPLPERTFIRRADAVITVSPSIAGVLQRLYGLRKPPLLLMNCPETVEHPDRRGLLRRTLGLSGEDFILLYQGALFKDRGLEVLIRAAALAPQVNFVLLGEGAHRERLEALAAELGIQARVFFPGRVPYADLLAYTQDADLGATLLENVALNHYYALPNKLFEYFMAGIPVLASSFPDTEKILIETGAGVTADPADPQQIARVLSDLAQDRLVLQRIAERARRASRRYNWEIEKEKLLALYRELEEKQPGRKG